jgi:hypothetical protein
MHISRSVWALAVMNLGVTALVAFALWYTHSLWAFLGLFFFFGLRPSQIPTTCPKCGCGFVATRTEKEDEED